MQNPEITKTARMLIGRFVRDRMDEKRIGYQRLARASGVHKSVIIAIVHGKRYNIDSLLAILGALRCRVFFETVPDDTPVGVASPGVN